ncbi:hypothetical protein F5B21DRAFT_471017 [Xylaria acuta]|nr:hypothetical protein F5B21DRAFT_471017 [Xylaria acuta]
MQFLNIVAVLVFASFGMASIIDAVEEREGDCSCSSTVTVTASETVATPSASGTVTVTVTISTAPGGDTGETPTGYGGGDVGESSTSVIVPYESGSVTFTLLTETSATPTPPIGGTETTSVETPTTPSGGEATTPIQYSGSESVTGTPTGTGTGTGTALTESSTNTGITSTHSHTGTGTNSVPEPSSPVQSTNAAAATGVIGMGALFGGAAVVAVVQHI